MHKQKITKNYCCIKCGNLISRDSAIYGVGQCKKCYIIFLKVSENNPMYGKKHSNKTKNKIAQNKRKNNTCCIDCGKTISPKAKRCLKCFHIFYKGENSPLYKNGLSLIDYYCVDCGKKISRGSKKCKSCANKLQNNPNWTDGLDEYGYSFLFNDKLKEKIRIRDNFMCQNCSMTEEEHLIVYGCVLHVHHIDYDKENCKEDNLITVCASCHMTTNFNRDYWYAYYTYIIDNCINLDLAKDYYKKH